MYQIWLLIAFLNLLGGCSFFIALLLFKKFSPEKNSSIIEITAAYVLINLMMMAAIYLRIIGQNRTVLPYRSLHAFTLGFTFYALFRYLFYQKPHYKYFHIFAGLAITYALFMFGPYSSRGGPIPPKMLLSGIEIVIIILSLKISFTLLNGRKCIAAIPWRRMQTTLGFMLMILPIVEFVDYARCNFFTLDPTPRNEGLIYMVSAVIANIALLSGLFGGLAGAKDVSAEGIPLIVGKVYGLSKREHEISGYILRGITNREIGELLHISTRTVDAHTRNIFQKCGISSRIELIRLIENYLKYQIAEGK